MLHHLYLQNCLSKLIVYGQRIPVRKLKGLNPLASVMSQVLQSYEQRIMDAALFELADRSALHLLVHTFDGLVVSVGASKRADASLRATIRAADQRAA